MASDKLSDRRSSQVSNGIHQDGDQHKMRKTSQNMGFRKSKVSSENTPVTTPNQKNID